MGEEVIKVAWGRRRVEGGSVRSDGDWTHSIMGFDEVKGSPRALVCWVAGRATEVMEGLGEEEVRRGRLLTMFGNGDTTLYVCGRFLQ